MSNEVSGQTHYSQLWFLREIFVSTCNRSGNEKEAEASPAFHDDGETRMKTVPILHTGI